MSNETNKMNMDYDKTKEMNVLLNLRKRLMSCLDMKKFIEIAKEIVDNSDSFHFKSERSKKFISLERPEFLLRCTELDKEDINKKDILEIDKITQKITRLVDKELISKFGSEIKNCVTNKEEFEKIFKELPKGLSEVYFTSIYTVRVSVKEGIVVMKYFV